MNKARRPQNPCHSSAERRKDPAREAAFEGSPAQGLPFLRIEGVTLGHRGVMREWSPGHCPNLRTVRDAELALIQIEDCDLLAL